jgi:hypothetical protein
VGSDWADRGEGTQKHNSPPLIRQSGRQSEAGRLIERVDKSCKTFANVHACGMFVRAHLTRRVIDVLARHHRQMCQQRAVAIASDANWLKSAKIFANVRVQKLAKYLCAHPKFLQFTLKFWPDYCVVQKMHRYCSANTT